MTVLTRRVLEPSQGSGLVERVQLEMSNIREEAFEQSLQRAEIRELLLTAEELYSVRDPANERLNRIKSVLRQKLNPRYENEQLSLFDDLDGFAFRDPKDNDKIVIHHPDVTLGYQLKRSTVISWKDVRRSVSLEKQRLQNLISAAANMVGGDDRIPELRGRKSALDWLDEQIEAYTRHRTRDDFVSVGEQDNEQED